MKNRKGFIRFVMAAGFSAGATAAILSTIGSREEAVGNREVLQKESTIQPLKASSRYRLNQLLAFHSPDDALVMVPVNDTVMGGVSSSEFAGEDGVGIFRGFLSKENGGGFASVRSKPLVADLEDYDGVAARLKGDGHRYSLNVYMENVFGGISWRYPLELPNGEWTDVAIPFENFRPMWRGRSKPEAGALDPLRITSFGFMIGDGQEGPFELGVGEVSAYKPTEFDG